MVTVTLSETDTVLLFEQPAVRVQQDSAESRLVCVRVTIELEWGGYARVAFGLLHPLPVVAGDCRKPEV